MFRTVAAAVLATAVLALPTLAQELKDGSEGMGGAAGHAMPLPDMSRSMGAPPPDSQAPADEAPEPMNAPPATDEEKKNENAPNADDASKTK